jgi:hypothetical protein
LSPDGEVVGDGDTQVGVGVGVGDGGLDAGGEEAPELGGADGPPDATTTDPAGVRQAGGVDPPDAWW